MEAFKTKAAQAALEYIEDNTIIGVGTGSTVYYFIQALKTIRHRIDACVASSKKTADLLREVGLTVLDLNVVSDLPLYVDGADEVNPKREMIKGGGGALAREKIIANVAQKFVCIVDESKYVTQLGEFPIAVEVLPLARSFVARELVKLGGDPVYREGFITDNGNIILDVYNLPIKTAPLEDALNILPGVVENGLFTKRLADYVLVGCEEGVRCLKVTSI